MLELNADATDYVPAQESEPVSDDFASKWEVLHMVLEDAPQKLTRRDILLEWPEDFEQPDATTLLRWLNRAIASDWVHKEGTGRKSDPFRYWLPERLAVWQKGPFYAILEAQNLPFTPLHERTCDKNAGNLPNFEGWDIEEVNQKDGGKEPG